MSYRAIYAYPWNLADEGVSAVVDDVRALGIDTITVAGCYHAGKFLQPHGREGKVYFPDDGTVYFKADPSRYGAIKPILSGLVHERDVLSEVAGAIRSPPTRGWSCCTIPGSARSIRSRRSETRSGTVTSTASVLLRQTRASTRSRCARTSRTTTP